MILIQNGLLLRLLLEFLSLFFYLFLYSLASGSAGFSLTAQAFNFLKTAKPFKAQTKKGAASAAPPCAVTLV